MKKSRRVWLLITLLCLGLICAVSPVFAAHPVVSLKDADGNMIAPGTNIPYSPKQTCGACHDYESAAATVNKDHGPGSPSYPGTESRGTAGYNVLYPQTGITSGFHFQQGRSSPWGDRQRSYYGLAAFTSSPGMYGKY